MADTALIQVLGAIAYGEQKAHDKAAERADAAADDAERRVWRTIAAEELRHHKGFVRRLRAMGADPERAMAPYKPSLDRFHAEPPDPDEVRAAVADLLGEGIASDLLVWLRKVVDADTAAFIDTVLADEAGHEARAAAELRRVIDASPGGRRRAGAGARRMLLRMAASGGHNGLPLAAFLRVGRGPELLAAITAGFARRLHLLGIGPVAALERLDPFGVLARLDPLRAGRHDPAA
jgi:DNA-binding ferritin-like protein (Dps family)